MHTFVLILTIFTYGVQEEGPQVLTDVFTTKEACLSEALRVKTEIEKNDKVRYVYSDCIDIPQRDNI
jgi:hypothetical protein